MRILCHAAASLDAAVAAAASALAAAAKPVMLAGPRLRANDRKEAFLALAEAFTASVIPDMSIGDHCTNGQDCLQAAAASCTDSASCTCCHVAKGVGSAVLWSCKGCAPGSMPLHQHPGIFQWLSCCFAGCSGHNSGWKGDVS